MAGELLPSLSPRAWESLLADRLAAAGTSALRFRLIRAEGRRAVVEVDHLDALRARNAWAAGGTGPSGIVLQTQRTWGTLVGAKAWLRERPADRRSEGVSEAPRRPVTGA